MSRLRPLRKNYFAPVLALVLTAGALAACSSASIPDMLPTAAGGLPSNAPQRPAVQPEYPAVNEMPRRPEALPLTDDEIKRRQTELSNLRKEQEERTGTLPKTTTEGEKKDAKDAKAAKKSKDNKDKKPPTELTSAKDQPK
jgi:hypothetical protein